MHGRDLADLRKLAVEKSEQPMHISPSAGDSGMGGHLSQNAGSMGYPTRQELGKGLCRGLCPLPGKKQRY